MLTENSLKEKKKARLHPIHWLCNMFLGEDGTSNLRTSLTRRC